MQKGQGRNISRAGKAGCLGLLALSLALINPVNSMAFAEGEEIADEAGVPATQEDIPSTIGISFSPATGSTSLSPTTSGGQSAQVNVLATVSVANSGGYSVYLKSNSLNLIGTKSSANIIPGATVAKTYANMDVNTWGYATAEGTMVPDNATYKAISVSGNGDKVAENNNKKIVSDTKKIMLSFAAKVNDEKPADTYKNTVTMSVVSSPLQTTLTDIANMQDMTSAICAASSNYETKQLKDTRDGKFYWVRKMPDNQCWMVQNLALDLGTEWPDASKSDYNDKVIAYAPTPTQTKQIEVDTSSTNTRSWNFGEWVIKSPTTSSDCGTGKNDLSTCISQFTNVTSYKASTEPDFYARTTYAGANGGSCTKTANSPIPIATAGECAQYDAHYLVGNYYSWNTATAGTGGEITTGEASGSICPKSWKLPTSNNTNAGSFGALTAVLTGANNTEKMISLTGDEYFFVRGGGVLQFTASLFAYAGDQGRYWSSTPYSNGSNAYNFDFYVTNSLAPSGNNPRFFGFSVRCIAR